MTIKKMMPEKNHLSTAQVLQTVIDMTPEIQDTALVHIQIFKLTNKKKQRPLLKIKLRKMLKIMQNKENENDESK
jgi:hypothetical protein